MLLRRVRAVPTSTASDFAKLGLRLALGAPLMAHGAQKLFGAFGGSGLEGTGEHFESKLGLKPGKQMAGLAGASELGGGALVTLGIGGPVGPAAVAGTMVVAARTAHAGKPFFAQAGGPELPFTDFAIAAALATFGFGRFSLDRALHARYPNVIRGMAFGVALVNAGALVARARHEKARAAADEPRPSDPAVTAGEPATERIRRQQQPA